MDTYKILLVEDNEDDALLLQAMLAETALHYTLEHARSLKEAKTHLDSAKELFDLILLDLDLPDSRGLETIVRVIGLTHVLPIIVLTGLDNEEISYSAIQTGAQDYLVKGKTDSSLLKRTIVHSCYRFQMIKKINAASEQQKAFFATHDAITGLPTGQVFFEQLKNNIARCSASKQIFAVTLIKVHEMEEIVKNFGVSGQNKTLKSISSVLQKEQRYTLGVYRFKDTVFGMILGKIDNIDSLTDYINTVRKNLNIKVGLKDNEYSPSYSIGSAMYPFDGKNSKQLLAAATASLERAEKIGYNGFEIYNKNLKFKQSPIILHTDLLAALDKNEFYIRYQPQLNLATNHLHGFEALLRWNHPQLGCLPPEAFIPIAEEHKLITPIGEWIVNTVCAQMASWKDLLNKNWLITVDVNISIHQLEYSNIYHFIESILSKYSVPKGMLGIELTESVFLSEPEKVIQKLNDLKELGVRIAIDDFGKGYSSLAYLSHLPIDYLKLDIEFIKDITHVKEKQSIVKSVIQLAHDLNLKVIAEGVEKKEQLDWLKENHCDILQGYLYSKPCTPEEVKALFISDESLSIHLCKMNNEK